MHMRGRSALHSLTFSPTAMALVMAALRALLTCAPWSCINSQIVSSDVLTVTHRQYCKAFTCHQSKCTWRPTGAAVRAKPARRRCAEGGQVARMEAALCRIMLVCIVSR